MSSHPIRPDLPRLPGTGGEAQLVEARPRGVTVQPANAAAQGLNVDDVLYILFRHKWKIVACTVLGLAIAGGIYFTQKPTYVSNAKLFIRYVIMEGKVVRPNDDTITKSPDRSGETIMSSEQEILTSLDLARNVAQAVGPEKIISKTEGGLFGKAGEKILGKPADGTELIRATGAVAKGLTVVARNFSSVINISFSHTDPEIAQTVLRQVVDQYLKMHVEIHRSAGMVGDFLAQETDQLRSRLAQTEDELRKAKAKAGVVSVEETKQYYAKQIEQVRTAIFEAKANQAQRKAIYDEMLKRSPKVDRTNSAPETESKAETTGQPSEATYTEYHKISLRVEALLKREQDMLTVFTAENSRVKEVHAQLTEAQEAKRAMEEKNPMLVRVIPPVPTSSGQSAASSATEQQPINLEFEAAVLNSLDARILALTSQLESLRKEVVSLDQLEGNIVELMRKRELEEGNYRRYAASLEQARINDALGSGKVSNISVIQTPSLAFPEPGKTAKTVGGVAAGGLGLGIAWALLIELLFDRSVRRPIEFSRSVRIPLFLSIPAMRTKSSRRKPSKSGTGKTEKSVDGAEVLVVAPDKKLFDTDPRLYPYHETLRDRLIGYFESRNLTHKPKLVAVTGIAQASGVTTTAAGLARCLSDTGDGNVLLVDLTPGQGSALHFHHGKAACGLEEILDTRANAQVQERLFVVSDGSGTDKLSRILPQRLSKLLPQLKASDFDYIIFDMPSVSEISITPRVAGLMDMVLLVVESEKSSREAVDRATTLLAQSKAHVGAVLNKTQSYVPAWLHQELPV